MTKPLHLISVLALAALPLRAQLGAEASFRGSLPPAPVAALSAEQEALIEKELAAVTLAFAEVMKHERAADADIFLKAVRYALEFDEWYDAKPEDGVKKALALLAEAQRRIESLKQNETPWMNGGGQKVLGFYSEIDGSPQPYGVEVPRGLDFGRTASSVPLWIWLHDRDDTGTDLHFIHAWLKTQQPGLFQPKETIVVHPFGRYCNGWKIAGETDVMECFNAAAVRFNADWERVALAGFGMGGTGAWHLGAHHADRWACVHTGGGLVDVQHAMKLTPEKFPPLYEQQLWGMYDVPDCARNFFDVPLVCYSGELDAQRESTDYLLQVLGKEGLHPPHLIGPGAGHRYHPDTLKEVQRQIEAAVAHGRETFPSKVSLQGRFMRYCYLHWLSLNAVDDLWADARIDAEIASDSSIRVTTVGVKSFDLTSFNAGLSGRTVIIDDQEIKLPDKLKYESRATFTKVQRPDDLFFTWHHDEKSQLLYGDDLYWPVKEGGSCIDGVFFDRFIFVLPDGPGAHPAVDAWVKAESQRAIRRWRSLMRGDPLVMTASQYLQHAKEPHEEDQQASLVLWGDATSNPLIATFLKHPKTPLVWDAKQVRLGAASFDAATHVPLLVFPNESIKRVRVVDDGTETAATGTIVINSGLTFREAHDKNHALQNPKLPDWAILDITQPPNDEAAGKVVAADFFDDRWRVKKAPAAKEQR